LQTATARFQQLALTQTQARRAQLEGLERLRQTLGYTETLRRGYAVVRAGEAVLTAKVEASKHQALEIEFSDGTLSVTPTGATPRPAPKKAGKQTPPDQGSLF